MVAPSSCCSAELTRAGALTIERRRVDDEHVFKERAQPGFPARDAVGLVQEFFACRDARRHVGIDRGALVLAFALEFRIARPDAPTLALHLVLARLDDEPKEIVSVGKAAQLGKADRLIGARADDEIVADRKIETPAGDIRRRDRAQRIERAEPVGATAARDAGRGDAASAVSCRGLHIDLIRRQRPNGRAGTALRFRHVGVSDVSVSFWSERYVAR